MYKYREKDTGGSQVPSTGKKTPGGADKYRDRDSSFSPQGSRPGAGAGRAAWQPPFTMRKEGLVLVHPPPSSEVPSDATAGAPARCVAVFRLSYMPGFRGT